MANPKWVKGHPPERGGGRPKGSKEKKWATLEYWFDMIEGDWLKLEPEKRIALVSEFVKLLIPRRTLPPQTPGDSVENAEIIMKEIEREEGPLGPKPGSGQVLLEKRTAQVQAPTAPAGSL